MTKKSFKNDPTLQFISGEKEEARETPQAENIEKAPKFTLAPGPEILPKTPATIQADRTPPPGMKLDPRYIETKNRRVNLMMQPSVAAKLKAISARDGVSVNEIMHSLAEELIAREGL